MPAHKKITDSYEPLVCKVVATMTNGQRVDIPPSEFLSNIKLEIPSDGVALIAVTLTDAKHAALMALMSNMAYGKARIAVTFGRGDIAAAPTYEGVLVEGHYTVSPESVVVAYKAVDAGADQLFVWSKNKPGDINIPAGWTAQAAFDKVMAAVGDGNLKINIHEDIKNRKLKENLSIKSGPHGNDEPWLSFLRRLAHKFSEGNSQTVFSVQLEGGVAVGVVKDLGRAYEKATRHAYSVSGDPSGEVIRFDVDDNSLRAAYNSTQVEHTGVDATSGSVKTSTTQGVNGDADGKATTTTEGSTSSAQRPDVKITIRLSDPEAFGAVAKAVTAQNLALRKPILNGTLTVRGTHDVQPFDIIDLEYKPYGYAGQHFLSGGYRVTSVSHSFSPAGWLTQITMFTDLTPVTAPNAKGTLKLDDIWQTRIPALESSGRTTSLPTLTLSDFSVASLDLQTRDALTVLRPDLKKTVGPLEAMFTSPTVIKSTPRVTATEPTPAELPDTAKVINTTGAPSTYQP